MPITADGALMAPLPQGGLLGQPLTMLCMDQGGNEAAVTMKKLGNLFFFHVW